MCNMNTIEPEEIYSIAGINKLEFTKKYCKKVKNRIVGFLEYHYLISTDEEMLDAEDRNNHVKLANTILDIISIKEDKQAFHEFLKEDPYEVVEIYKLKQKNSDKRKRFQEKLKEGKDINDFWKKLKKTKLYIGKMQTMKHVCFVCKKEKQGFEFSSNQLKKASGKQCKNCI